MSDALKEAGVSFSLVLLNALAGLYGNVELEGLKTVLGVGLCDVEVCCPARVPYRSSGKVADMGERASGLKPSFVGEKDCSSPNPTGCS